MPLPTHSPHPMRTQQGSILVQFALLALVLLAILGVVQIGYMYSSKRDLQRIADLAALEAANHLQPMTTCGGAQTAGKKSIDKQWPPEVTPQEQDKQLECGHWSAEGGYGSGALNGVFNAVQVTLTGETLQLVPFTGSRTVKATATAALTNDPTATFSVGAGVARLNGGALNALLSGLLGTSVNLSAVDYTGLANTKVNLLGLKEALNLSAGTYDQLLNAEVNMQDLLTASLDVARRSGSNTVASSITAMNNLATLLAGVNLNGLMLNLLKDGTQSGLLELSVDSNDRLAGLQADANLLNILTVGLQVAQKDAAISLPATALDLGPLATATVAVKVIEPPSIASGRAGTDASGKYITTAHNGQVRAAIKITALKALGNDETLLNLPLLVKVSLPSQKLLTLPINLEVGSADARLEEIRCNAQPNTHEVRISAKPGLAYISLAEMPDAMTNTTQPWSNLTKDRFPLLNLRVQVLLGLLDISVKLMAKVDVPIDSNNYQMLKFEYATNKPYADQASDLTKSVGSEQQLGQSIGSALTPALMNVEIETSGLGIASNIVDALLNNVLEIVTGLLPIVQGLLNPILTLLDSVLGPLLKLLGLQIGYADVQLLDVNCNNPAQLVY